MTTVLMNGRAAASSHSLAPGMGYAARVGEPLKPRWCNPAMRFADARPQP